MLALPLLVNYASLHGLYLALQLTYINHGPYTAVKIRSGVIFHVRGLQRSEQTGWSRGQIRARSKL